MDIQTLIEAAGGVVRLAAIAGVSRPTVLGWRKLGFIPAFRVPRISEALGLPRDKVWALAYEPPPRIARARKKAKRPARSRAPKRKPPASSPRSTAPKAPLAAAEP